MDLKRWLVNFLFVPSLVPPTFFVEWRITPVILWCRDRLDPSWVIHTMQGVVWITLGVSLLPSIPTYYELPQPNISPSSMNTNLFWTPQAAMALEKSAVPPSPPILMYTFQHPANPQHIKTTLPYQSFTIFAALHIYVRHLNPLQTIKHIQTVSSLLIAILLNNHANHNI